MACSRETLQQKLTEMYPEIETHKIGLALDFDTGKNAWIVTLVKGDHTLSTFLEKQDADACVEGDRCVYVGLQIGQFVENFEAQDANPV